MPDEELAPHARGLMVLSHQIIGLYSHQSLDAGILMNQLGCSLRKTNGQILDHLIITDVAKFHGLLGDSKIGLLYHSDFSLVK